MEFYKRRIYKVNRRIILDIFEEYINKKNESSWVKRALTDPSFNDYRKRGVKKGDPNFSELNTPLPVNTDLATYGDAVIKLCYLEIMFDKEKKLTEAKSKVESDEYLVDVVARHYDLLNFIDRDKEDKKRPNDYNYSSYNNTNNNPCKYIATAVEAVIGAIYKETKDLKPIIELLNNWLELQNS